MRPPFPSVSWFIQLTVLRRCWSHSLLPFLRSDLFYVLPCVILFLCFSVLLTLRLPRLGKRELMLVLFVRLFDLCLFGFVGFLFLLVSGKAAGCDGGTPWTFFFFFFFFFRSRKVFLLVMGKLWAQNGPK